MLGNSKVLTKAFPKLFSEGRVILSGTKKFIRVCTLNWPKREISYLPSKYDDWIDSFKFSISEDYMKEIVRNSERAIEEWNTYRSFDTCVRDMCLEPAEAHVRVAFKLIADCLYDPETEYYDRSDEKFLASYAMIYKFWGGETGSGLLWWMAELDHLQRTYITSPLEGMPPPPEKVELVRVFLDDIREFEKNGKELSESLSNPETSKDLLGDL